MDNFIRSVDTPVEAIEVFKQLQPLLSKYGFEQKILTKEIPEDMRSISDTNRVEVEPSKMGSSVLALQWTVTEDSLQVCGDTSKEVETQITQWKPFSLVSFCTFRRSHETTS